jgi:hypothetical protein
MATKKMTRKLRRYKYVAGGPKVARYRAYGRNRMTGHHGTNMVYTEAQSLEEAVDIILQKRQKRINLRLEKSE